MESYILPLISLLCGGAATGGLWWSLNRRKTGQTSVVSAESALRSKQWPSDQRPSEECTRAIEAYEVATNGHCSPEFIVKCLRERLSPFQVAQQFIGIPDEAPQSDQASESVTVGDGLLRAIRIVKCLGSSTQDSMGINAIAKTLGVDPKDVEQILNRYPDQFEYVLQVDAWRLK